MTLSKLINKILDNFDKLEHEQSLYLLNNDKDKIIKFLTKCIQEAYQTGREENIKEEHEICKKIHLIELNRWSIYEPNADECFEEEYQSLTNKEVNNSKSKL